MPTAIVTERWSDWQFTRGKSGKRALEISGVTTQAEAEAAVPPEVAVGEPHPLSTKMRIPTGGIGWSLLNPAYYLATIAYEAIEDADLDEDEIDTRLAEKWRIEPQRVASEEATDHDGAGMAVLSSSGEPIQGAFSRPTRTMILKMWRWETGSDVISKDGAYSNKWNSDSVTLPKVGTASAGQLLCLGIEFGEEVQADAGICKVIYTFEARPYITIHPLAGGTATLHGFHRRVMDLGFHGVDALGPGDITQLTEDTNGKQTWVPVSTAVRLNGTGKPLNTGYKIGKNGGTPLDILLDPPRVIDKTSDAAFVMYDRTDGSIAFSGLGISANL